MCASRTPFCLYASTRDPRDPPDVLPGCGVIVPIAHRPSPSTSLTRSGKRRTSFSSRQRQPRTSVFLRTVTRSSGTAHLISAMRTCTSSLASTTSRSRTEAGGRPSRSGRTDGPIRSGKGTAARDCLGGEADLALGRFNPAWPACARRSAAGARGPAGGNPSQGRPRRGSSQLALAGRVRRGRRRGPPPYRS